MSGKRYQILVSDLVSIYGISRQRIHQLNSAHGLSVEDWYDPTTIFNALLKDNSSPLRQKLVCPHRRQNTRELIAIAAEARGVVAAALQKAKL
jgi:hypothetical protein